MTTTDKNVNSDVENLNVFLKNELAAIDSYGQCIEKIDDFSVTTNLEDLQRSHQRRADMISNKIQQLGGKPEEDAGVWGDFSILVEGGASLFGEKAAIAALEKGEGRGEVQYREKMENLSPDVRAFIGASILPEHLNSHETLQRVQRMVH
ncbi:MAG TPA: DUF2383 domain-containing protein [Cellvibrionaceae bacterium]